MSFWASPLLKAMVVPSGDQAAVRALMSGSPIWTAPVVPSAAATKTRDEQKLGSTLDESTHAVCGPPTVRAVKASFVPSGDHAGAAKPEGPLATSPEATWAARSTPTSQ